MKRVIRTITKIPNDLFIPARNEVALIDWKNLSVYDRRSEEPVFRTSISNHLRIHDASEHTPHTIEALSEIVECIDTPARSLYAEVDKLVNWIYDYVEGTKLGRIMLVKLLSGGIIGEHTDPGQYFLEYYRFHVPFFTNPEVMFYGYNEQISDHMLEGHLCQLANRRPHSAKNLSKEDRVHLIVDIKSLNTYYDI